MTETFAFVGLAVTVGSAGLLAFYLFLKLREAWARVKNYREASELLQERNLLMLEVSQRRAENIALQARSTFKMVKGHKK